VCDLALVMTINPGYGGQKLIPRTLRKVERVRAEIDRQGLDTEIEVDGGVDASNARACVEAGANVLVAGTAVFGHPDGPAAGGQAVLNAGSGAGAGVTGAGVR
jgi:ribulose-phosphate 3-epimerase